MNWIKRNLIFVIGSLVALLLMGGASFYTYSRWQANAKASEELGQAYEELKRLNNQNPHPGDGRKVDNIKLAREQEQEVRRFLTNTFKQFDPIPAIPHAETNLTRVEFGSALRLTIAQLQREATNNSVVLPASYNFSFEAQRQKAFELGNPPALAVQLGEVKTICDILNRAKINALLGVRRERVSAEDNTGPMTDYLAQTTETNELALLTPYEVTFQSFSAELAAVVSGFANSPHAILVKSINVRPAAAGGLVEPSLAGYEGAAPAQIYYPQMAAPGAMPPGAIPGQLPAAERSTRDLYRDRYGIGGGSSADMFRQRYGIGPGGGKDSLMSRYQQRYTPAPVAPVATVPAAAAPRGGLQPMLDEQQLEVTIALRIVKLLPAK